MRGTVGILDFILRANRKPVLSSSKGVSGANVRFEKIQRNVKTGLEKHTMTPEGK